MAFFIVGIGGMLGSVTRYFIGGLINKYINSVFPYATLIINIIGALMLGILSARLNSGELYLLAGEGFLGAFTTFSTFMYEGFDLIKNNKYLNAVLYVSVTFIMGVIGFGAGYYCFR